GLALTEPVRATTGGGSRSASPGARQRPLGEHSLPLSQAMAVLHSWTHSPRSQCWPLGQSALSTHGGCPDAGGGAASGASAAVPPSTSRLGAAAGEGTELGAAGAGRTSPASAAASGLCVTWPLLLSHPSPAPSARGTANASTCDLMNASSLAGVPGPVGVVRV